MSNNRPPHDGQENPYQGNPYQGNSYQGSPYQGNSYQPDAYQQGYGYQDMNAGYQEQGQAYQGQGYQNQGMGYQPPVQGYADQGMGYQQQGQAYPEQGAGYQQQPYQPQNAPYQGYGYQGQNAPYQGQGNPYPDYTQTPNGYGQQSYDQQGFVQPAWNGTQQQAPMYGGAQEMPPEYPQYTQEGQRYYPVSGRSGFHVQKVEKKEIPWDTIARIAMLGVLPVLFVLSMIFSFTVGKWVVLIGAIVSVTAMWLREMYTPNARLILSLLLVCAAIVCLVSTASPNEEEQQTTQMNQGNMHVLAQNGAVQNGNTSSDGNYLGVSLTTTEVPPEAPTPTPEPEDDSDECYAQLHSFFTLWKNNAVGQMVNLTAPSWRKTIKGGTTEAVETALFSQILNNRTPVEWTFENITGTSSDSSRKVTVRAVINKNNTLANSVYMWKVLMVKEDGVWYVDPLSLQSNEQESTATPTNAKATQPVLNTSHPDLVLYYNPEGGTKYHIDPNCPSTNKKYLPFSGSFKYSEINHSPYSELKQCSECGAPLREQ